MLKCTAIFDKGYDIHLVLTKGFKLVSRKVSAVLAVTCCEEPRTYIPRYYGNCFFSSQSKKVTRHNFLQPKS